MVTALSLHPASAVAQDEAGLYVGIYGGITSAASTDFSESRTAAPDVSGNVDFGGGIGFGFALGKRFANGWAIELAWDERGNTLDSVGGVAVDGNIFSEVVYVNGYYRFPPRGRVRPFVGAGLGYALSVDIDVERDGQELEYSREGSLAVQAIAGVEYSLSSNWKLSGDVRWSHLSSGDFEAATAGSTLTGEPDYQPLSLNIGISYQF
jgi:outer membrane protein W